MSKTIDDGVENLADELRITAQHFNENKYVAKINSIESEALTCAKAQAAAGLFTSVTYSLDLSVDEVSQAVLKKMSGYGFSAVIKKEDNPERRGTLFSLTLNW